MPQRKDLLLISVKSYRNRMCLGIGLKITIIIMMIITSIFVLFNLAALVEIIKCNLSKNYMVSIQLPCQFPYSWFKSPQPFWHKMNERTRKLCFAGDYKLALMAGPSMLSLFITKPSALSALDSLMHPCGGAVDLPGCQWHTPPGHIRQDAPDRKPGSLSGKKRITHSIRNVGQPADNVHQTLTSLPSLTPSGILQHARPLAHLPPAAAAAAGSLLRCFGTLLAGIQLRSAGKTDWRRRRRRRRWYATEAKLTWILGVWVLTQKRPAVFCPLMNLPPCVCSCGAAPEDGDITPRTGLCISCHRSSTGIKMIKN